MSDATYTRQGKARILNVSSPTIIATVPPDFAIGQCRLVRVQVLIAGSAGAAYDTNNVGQTSIGNQVAAWPGVIGTYLIDMPCLQGICIVPGGGQTVAVTFD